MSCFCHAALAPLTLPGLSVAANVSLSTVAQAALALDARLQLGIPGLPSGWLNLPVPQVNMDLNAVASLAAMAQLQAQARAQLGLDLGTPLGAAALARMAATLNARLPSLPPLQLAPWLQLASLQQATARLQAALDAGLTLPLTAEVVTPPAWLGFTANLQLLSLLMSLSANLSVSLSSTTQLQAAIQAMLALRLPALPPAQLVAMAQLSAGLGAIAQLRAGLGINPLQLGFPQVQAMVAANFSEMATALLRAGIDVRLALPTLPPIPGLPAFATQATVNAALNLRPPALDLAFTESMYGSLGAGLAVSSLAINLNLALDLQAQGAPCAICDARALVAAIGSAAA